MSLPSFGQNNCGTVPSQADINNTINLQSSVGCVDTSSGLDETEPITLNLILRYAKDGQAAGEISQTDRNTMEATIDSVYDDHNISFNYIWTELNCLPCMDNYNNWPDPWPNQIQPGNCMIGDILSLGTTESSGFTGMATAGTTGRFWAYGSGLSDQYTIAHEIGHAIGLYHTWGPGNSNINSYTTERVTRNNSPCDCNCGDTGDFVCDTPPDPYFTDDPYGIWNGPMYSACALTNDNDEKDDCLVEYADPDGILHSNLMSYVNNTNCGDFELTGGQNILIRKSLKNTDGSYKFQLNPGEIPLTQGFSVNVPTTKNTDEAFNGDIVVNSDLTIQGCTIELTEGHKIIVNAGAKLTIINATVRTYTGSICYFPMAGKKEWEGIEVAPSFSGFASISIESNSTIETSEVGIYNVEGSEGLLNLAFRFSTLNGPAITLSNTLGIQKLFKSNFSSTVSVTDNFYLAVEGCNFNFPMNSEDPGVIAQNTSLLVGNAYPNIPSKFYNCHTSVDFISESIHTLAVIGVEFYDVIDGVSAHGAGGLLTVSDCKMNLRDGSNAINGATGIYNNNMMDFKIYNNEIHGANTNNEYGIELTTPNENANPNLLINNKIYDCSNGINSQSNSDDYGDNISGVEFECNQFFNIQGDNFRTAEIGPKQGRGVEDENERAAGNVFDGSNVGFQEFNYAGGGSDLTKYYFRDATNEEPIYYNPDTHPGFGHDRFTKEKTNANPICTYPVINNDPQQLPIVRTQIKGLYDGGDTDGVIKLVEDDSDHDPTGVIISILPASPWVSVAVIQTLLEYGQYYTGAEFVQVVLANPGVIVNPYIYDVVFDSGSISSAIQLDILNAYNAGDARIDFENGLTDIFLDGAVYSNGVIEQEVVTGTLNMGIIRGEIEKKISRTKYFQIIETYLLENDYSNALLALTSKNDIRTKDPILLTERVVYGELVDMKVNLGNQGNTWDKLSIQDYNRVVQIANTYYGYATAKARNILKIYYGQSFGGYPSKPAYPSVTFLAAGTRSAVSDTRINVYPNPTKEYINIDLISDLDVTLSQLKLYNTKGEMILRTALNQTSNKIDVSSIHSGIYYYEILTNDNSLMVDKIIVIK